MLKERRSVLLGAKLTGVDQIQARLKKINMKVAIALDKTTLVALNLLKGYAQKTLNTKIYDVQHGPFWDPRTEFLLNSFVTEVFNLGEAVTVGKLSNTDPKAIWFEYGTPEHTVGPAKDDVMIWRQEWTGEFMFETEAHKIRGIEAIHFMEFALREHIPDIV